MPKPSMAHTREVQRILAASYQNGCRAIATEGSITHNVATLGPFIFAIAKKQGKGTHRQLRTKWTQYDGVLTHTEPTDQFLDHLRSQGFRIIRTGGKVPDALIHVNGEWCAVKAIPLNKDDGRGTYAKKDAAQRYSMWDRVLLHPYRRKQE